MAITHILLSLVVALSGVLNAAAEEAAPLQGQTPNTYKGSAQTKSPPATLEAAGWLAGYWTGTGLGGFSEEMWSNPASGAMLGTFRLIKDGNPVLYELMTLIEHEGSLLLRLKHFHPDLKGWEEKDDSLSFRLLKAGPGEIAFDGLTFRREGNDRLLIFLAMRSRKDGSVREEAFQLTRARTSG